MYFTSSDSQTTKYTLILNNNNLLFLLILGMLCANFALAPWLKCPLMRKKGCTLVYYNLHTNKTHNPIFNFSKWKINKNVLKQVVIRPQTKFVYSNLYNEEKKKEKRKSKLTKLTPLILNIWHWRVYVKNIWDSMI